MGGGKSWLDRSLQKKHGRTVHTSVALSRKARWEAELTNLRSGERRTLAGEFRTLASAILMPLKQPHITPYLLLCLLSKRRFYLRFCN